MLKKHACGLLFLLSFALRFAAWLWVIVKDTPLYADELAYFQKTLSCANALTSLFHGHWPTAAVCDGVYGYGVWPPLHTFILALGSLCAGVGGARFAMVLLSSLSTPLLFKLARHCGFSFRVACCAALFHALYPEVIGFSHYLWSETSFTFFLLAGLTCFFEADLRTPRGGVPTGEAGRCGRDGSPSRPPIRAVCSRALRTPRGGGPTGGARGGTGYALAAGALLGCAGLCRATVLPIVLCLAAWGPLAALPSCRRDKTWSPLLHPVLRGTALLGMFLLVAAPWLITLRAREGEWKAFSTSGGYNLYTGNHPAIPKGLGSAWGMFAYEGGACDQIAQMLAAQHGGVPQNAPLWSFGQDHACRQAAWRVIRSDPAAAVERAFLRLGTLFAPDLFLPRHILNLVYRPMPLPLAAGLITANLLAWLLVLIGLSNQLGGSLASLYPGKRARSGLLSPKLLAVTSALLLLLPVLATISLSRVRFTSTVLLLPFACQGLSACFSKPRTPPPPSLLLSCACALVSFALCLLFCARTTPHFIIPSSVYAPIIRTLASAGLLPPSAYDTFTLRHSGPVPAVLGLSLPDWPQTNLLLQPQRRELGFPFSPSSRQATLQIQTALDMPVRFQWFNPRTKQNHMTVFDPAHPPAGWQPTVISASEIKWTGANARKARWSDAAR